MTNEGDRNIQGQAKDGSKVAGVMDEEGHCGDRKKKGVHKGDLSPYSSETFRDDLVFPGVIRNFLTRGEQNKVGCI